MTESFTSRSRWPRTDSPEVEAAAEAGMRCAEDGGSFVNIARAVIDAYHGTGIAAYVDRMELIVCGEWHLNQWPNCDHPDHDRGRSLLSEKAKR